MRTLTLEERVALVEVGEPGEGPVSDATFAELARLGWGRWAPNPDNPDDPEDVVWCVTPAGRYALELDTIARSMDLAR